MLLELENVSKSFGEGNSRTEVLKDINLKIAEGEFVAIVGFTGSGKTTLIKLIAGLLKPERGEILFKGQPVIRPGKERGVVFQNYSLLPWCTVFQNVMLAVDAVYPRWTSVQRANHAKQYIEMVNLSAAMNKRPRELSGGMRQRVTIALASLLKPRIMIGDEPTTALDVVVQRGVIQMLKAIQENFKNTIVLVTHDMGVHANIADRIGIMYAGKIVEEGTTEQIFRQPLHPYTQFLINSLPKFGDKNLRDSVPGSPPSLANLPVGCPFHPRCPHVKEICRQQMPGFSYPDEDHKVACWLIGEGKHG